MRHLRRALLVLALLLVAGMAGLGLWLRSEGALHWALAQAQLHSGGSFKVGSSEGSLARPILLKDVEWDSGAVAVHVDSLRLQWRPLAALIGRAQLSSVIAEHVILRLRASGSGSKTLQAPVMPMLPVRIVLEDVQVQDVQVLIGSLPPVQIDALRFAARVDNDAIVVRELKATGPDISVQGNATLAPHRDYAVDAGFDWRYRTGGWAPLQGHTELKGNDHALAVRQTLASPYGADLVGTLRDVFAAPRWEGSLRLTHTDLADIHAEWPDYRGDARLDFRGDPDGTAFKGDASVRGLPVGDVNARLDATLKPHVAEIRSLSLAIAGGGQLFAKGRLGLDAATLTALTGSWQDLGWPRTDPYLQSPSGEFKLADDHDTWRADLDGAITPQASVHAYFQLSRSGGKGWTLQADAAGLQGQKFLRRHWQESLLPSGDWRLMAHGDATRATVDSLTGGWLGGNLAVNGLYQRGRVDSWRMHAVVRDAGVGRLLHGWSGKVDGVVDADGSVGDGAPRTEVILESLHGALRGSPLDAHGEVSFAGAAWQQLTLDAKLGDDVLHADTDQRNRDVLHWRLDAPNLAQAWPDASGELRSHGSLETGSHLTLMDIDLDARQVAWHGWAADGLQLSAKAGSDGKGVAVLHGTGVDVPGVSVSQLDAHAEGHIEQHALQLDITSDRGRLHLAGDGGYADRRWQAHLTRVDVTPAGDGEWQAVAPWSLTLAPHLLELQQACLAHDAAHACASITANAQDWRAQGTLKALPIAAMQAVLPAGLEYSGSVNADIKASGDASGHRLAVDATLSPGAVRDLRRGKALTLLAYTGGEAHMRSDPRATVGHMSWMLTDGGSLQVDTRMNFGAQPVLSGRIRGDIHDFALLPALLPQVTQASGRLALDIGLTGTPSDPLFSGTTTLSDGAVSIPRLGLNLSGLQLTLAGDGEHLDVAGSVRSGKGNLSLKGSADRDAGVWKAKGQLQGEDFRSIDILEAQVDLSPDLNFSLDGRDLKVDGTVKVPHAALKPRDLSGTAQVSPDQVLVGEEGGPPEERWHLRSRINVMLGDDVYFDGFGLTGDITGSVMADTEPGHVTTGSGELNVKNGFYAPQFIHNAFYQNLYSALQQKLSIEYGRLLFTGGPITDPALDVRAVRGTAHPEMVQFGQVEQKVGVQVRGLLTAPNISLWADPPLPQSQLIAYLITGRPNNLEGGSGGTAFNNGTPGVVTASSLSGTSAQSNQDVSLHLGGGNPLAVDVGYQSIQTGNGTLLNGVFIGKQLAEKLYVRYGQSTDQAYNVLQIIYQISTQWMVQAQSGTASSADIFYTIEH
ncbi:MAG TPA: translocation/assembly module TamB domain-containing protein [Gammaproteobacteria bacterium]|nr:translocation/assembly module TamB domain-containing protein [Gammaproteobacteria bacterium]